MAYTPEDFRRLMIEADEPPPAAPGWIWGALDALVTASRPAGRYVLSLIGRPGETPPCRTATAGFVYQMSRLGEIRIELDADNPPDRAVYVSPAVVVTGDDRFVHYTLYVHARGGELGSMLFELDVSCALPDEVEQDRLAKLRSRFLYRAQLEAIFDKEFLWDTRTIPATIHFGEQKNDAGAYMAVAGGRIYPR